MNIRDLRGVCRSYSGILYFTIICSMRLRDIENSFRTDIQPIRTDILTDFRTVTEIDIGEDLFPVITV